MFIIIPVCFIPLNFHWVNDLPNCLITSSTSKRDSVHSSLVSQSNTSPLNNTLHHMTNATNIFHNPATLKYKVYFCLSSMPKIIFLTEFIFNAYSNLPRFFFFCLKNMSKSATFHLYVLFLHPIYAHKTSSNLLHVCDKQDFHPYSPLQNC